jgi:hypothetical protein
MTALNLTAGRVWLTNGSGEITFDTNERMFISTDGILTGSVSLPAYSASVSRVGGGGESRTQQDVANTYALASINAAADTVLGGFKVTSSAGGVSNQGWFCAGGTYMHGIMVRLRLLTGVASIIGSGGAACYTFRAAGGSLLLDETVAFDPGTIGAFDTGSFTITQDAMTIDYKLYVGTFN